MLRSPFTGVKCAKLRSNDISYRLTHLVEELTISSGRQELNLPETETTQDERIKTVKAPIIIANKNLA
jgi:hypothetical protein